METIETLLDRSMEATKRVQRLERLLFKFEKGSEQGHLCYEVLQIARDRESEARAAVRSHPDHSYDGL